MIVDNAGGHLMQHGKVDLCIVGTDRTTATGDVCNKIGTYLKALAAHDNGVPFYVALPHSTIDWTLARRRPPDPDRGARRRRGDGHARPHRRTAGWPPCSIDARGSPAANYAFDVTPARLVTGLITERGVCAASRGGTAGPLSGAAGGHRAKVSDGPHAQRRALRRAGRSVAWMDRRPRGYPARRLTQQPYAFCVRRGGLPGVFP